MSAFTDFLIKSLLPTIQMVGESKLVDVLQSLHDTNEEQYKATIIAGHTFIKPLIAYVAKTETSIDDGFVAAIDEAITVSAVKNGIVLE